MGWPCAPRASEAEHALDLRGVAISAGEVVEGALGDADDVVADEGRALFGVLQTALQFEHRPAAGSEVMRWC